MNNWIREVPAKANGNYEKVIGKYFTGDPIGDKLDKIANMMEQQLYRQKFGGGGGGDDGGYFTRNKVLDLGAIIVVIAVLMFMGFSWLEGKFTDMMEKASPYAREKALIEIKQEMQDSQIKDLNQHIIDLDIKVTNIQQYLRDTVETTTPKKKTRINDIQEYLKGDYEATQGGKGK